MTPRVTYRLQFNKDFGFEKAAEIAPYLSALGVSHVYASPWLKARPGSSHGYDIVDHHVFNPELGDRSAFDRMVAAFKANGLGQILDFVPNHMGVGGADNPLWLDVLEWGPNSAYAGWFDIDWEPDRSYLRDKVLVPFLGDQYGVELYKGKLALKFDELEGSFAVWAYESHKLPICPLYYHRILGDAHPELERLGDAFFSLRELRPPQVFRSAQELKREIAQAIVTNPDVKRAISSTLQQFSGVPGEEESWRNLHTLIEEQYWRAAHFRVAADDINYRRFFNINDLAGLRMELPEVFAHAHTLVLTLLGDGTLDGLRIDHVDGLLNPKKYLQCLRAALEMGDSTESFYLIVEKILARHENLREDWPVDGTTGYEFANLILGFLIDPAGEERLTQTYIEFTGNKESFADAVRDCKLRIMRSEMTSELNMLGREAARVAHQNPKTADFTRNALRHAIREVVACFPVYRTYIDAEGAPTDDDLRELNRAMERARANEPDLDSSVFDFVYKLLSGDLVAHSRSGFSRKAVLRCAMKLQQYSGPVMAKGLEDTAFYRYNRFIALNEVGGSPDQFGVSISNFHKANRQRAKRWPRSMLGTSTHDTKRGEDARARLAVLSELPEEWTKQVNLWSRLLRARRGDIEALGPPDRNDEYFFYQLLAGTWPLELTGSSQELDFSALVSYSERLKQTITKSVREAKVHSTWASPNEAYEAAFLSFVDDALDPNRSEAFFEAFLPFQKRVARLGIQNSLVQATLKLTSPGIPDIYQGTELWDFSMVDPDNRRPVNYDQRIRLLKQIDQRGNDAGTGQLFDGWHDGAVKLFLISRILALRAAEPELFSTGVYEPLTVTGPKSECLFAFVRRLQDHAVIVLVTRFPARLEAEPGWSGTVVEVSQGLPTNHFRSLLTGTEVRIDTGIIHPEPALGELPAAVLVIDEKSN